jgi:exopolysaccharide production protein ExoZ
MVVAFHIGGELAQGKYFGQAAVPVRTTFGFGDAGVPVFFVLSGLVIMLAHRADLGQPRRLTHYLWRRVSRIYPPYLIVFTLACLAAASSDTFRPLVPHGWTLLKSLLLWPQNPGEVGGTGAPVLWAAWTLQYEVYFYALVAVAVCHRRAGMVLGLVVLAGTLFGRIWPYTSFPAIFLFNPLVLLFGLGGVAACLLNRARPLLFLPPLVLAGPSLALFAALAACESQFGVAATQGYRFAVYGLTAAGTMLGLARWEQGGALRRPLPLVNLLGEASYALYLLHLPLMGGLSKTMSALGWQPTWAVWPVFALTLLWCVLGAVAFHKLVERPVWRWLQGLGKPMATTRQMAQGAVSGSPGAAPLAAAAPERCHGLRHPSGRRPPGRH